MGAVNSWTDGTDKWSIATDWSLGHSPVATPDSPSLLQSDAIDRIVSFDVSLASVSTLTVDSTGAGLMTLFQGANALVTIEEDIGLHGKGAFNQTGGTNTITGPANSYMFLGKNSGASGSYTLSGGTASAVTFYVGGTNSVAGGTGTIVVNGGAALTASTGLWIWNTPGSSVTLNGGSITAGFIETNKNTGHFVWTAGALSVTSSSGLALATLGSSFTLDNTRSLAVTGTLTISSATSITLNSGTLSPASLMIDGGSITFAGGTLTTALSGSGSEYVGYTTAGAVTQTGGTNKSVHGLYLGHDAGSSGTYSLSGSTSTLQVTATEFVGYSGTGMVIQSGGTHQFIGSAGYDLYLGYNAGSSGTYNLSGGFLSNTEFESIGVSGTGVFNQSGGTNSAFDLFIGDNASGKGTYSLSAGTMTPALEVVGQDGNGTFVQTGGLNSINFGLDIGDVAGASGDFSLSGTGSVHSASLTVGGDTTAGGKGVLTISGGLMSATGTMRIWNTPGTNVTLSGGTLSAGTLNFSSTPSLFTWLGGNLRVTGSTGLTLGTSNLGTSFTLGATQALNVTNTLTVPAGGVLTVGGGTLAVGTLQVNGTYSQTGGTATLTNVAVASTGSFTAPRITSTSLNVTGSAALMSGGGTSRVSSLTITSLAKLDLANNALIVDYTTTSPLPAVRAALVSGFNGGGWDGNGINSSTAQNDTFGYTAIGVAEASDLGVTSFGGLTVGTKSVLLKYTDYGDSNLDGNVDTADFQRFIDGLAGGGSTWSTGDYNYDGKVDLGNDFNLFLSGYMLQGGMLGELRPFIAEDSALSVAQRAQLLAVVPEPAAFGAMGLGMVGALARRKKRRF